MGPGISEVLPFAVGVAISPVPIIAVILMLLSSRASTNGPAFLLEWAGGLTVLCALLYAVADAIPSPATRADPTACRGRGSASGSFFSPLLLGPGVRGLRPVASRSYPGGWRRSTRSAGQVLGARRRPVGPQSEERDPDSVRLPGWRSWTRRPKTPSWP